jgi:hypothetical protein
MWLPVNHLVPLRQGADEMEQLGWMEENTRAMLHNEEAIRKLENILSEQEDDDLKELLHEIETAHRWCIKAQERYSHMPADKFREGEILTEEEFYIDRARGLLSVKVDDKTEYDILRLCHYADDDWSGYIDIGEKCAPVEQVETGLREGYVLLRFSIGKYPEDLHLSALRPEQIEYFAKFPGVLERFQK